MQNTFSYKTLLKSPDATSRFASKLASVFLPGDTLLLEGPIGAGKSHFARAFIQKRLAAAGIFEDVPSPTFTLVQTYNDQQTEIWHSDLYRLTNIADIDELGLWEAFETAICLVEWPDRLGPYSPKNALTLALMPEDHEAHRTAHLKSSNLMWRKRLSQGGIISAP